MYSTKSRNRLRLQPGSSAVAFKAAKRDAEPRDEGEVLCSLGIRIRFVVHGVSSGEALAWWSILIRQRNGRYPATTSTLTSEPPSLLFPAESDDPYFAERSCFGMSSTSSVHSSLMGTGFRDRFEMSSPAANRNG